MYTGCTVEKVQQKISDRTGGKENRKPREQKKSLVRQKSTEEKLTLGTFATGKCILDCPSQQSSRMVECAVAVVAGLRCVEFRVALCVDCGSISAFRERENIELDAGGDQGHHDGEFGSHSSAF